MTHKFKVIGNSYCSQFLELNETQINAILERININVSTPNANKLLYLHIGLSNCSVNEAVSILVDELFTGKINNELKSYFEFKLLTNVEELFDKEIYQKDLLMINNIIATVFDLPHRFYNIFEIGFILKEEINVGPIDVLKLLVDNSTESSKLRNWYETSFEQDIAENLILDLTSYSDISHRALINSYWLKKEDLVIK